VNVANEKKYAAVSKKMNTKMMAFLKSQVK
jgi:hypothetical protein